MKKRWFQRYLTNFGVVDFNTPDTPGGDISAAGAGGDNQSGDDAMDDTMGRSDTMDQGDQDNDQGDQDNDQGDQGDQDNDTLGASNKRFEALENKFSDLMSVLGKDTNTDSDDDGSGNLSGLEHEDLVNMMADDPAGFISKLTTEIEKSVTDRVAVDNANNTYDGKIESTINTYADANPDFEAMWDNGSIKAFMDDNPGHNALSAHMAITMEARLAEATKTGEDTAIRNYRTKSDNQVLGNGPGIPPEQRDAALKDPSKFGGAAAVLALRAGIQ